MIVNDLTIKINNQEIDHKTLEEAILKHINKIGNLMEQEILEKVKEPTIENKITINDKQAVFSQKRNLRFINRFGYSTVISRRGKTGIESLKAPTEYKEANIVVIEKYSNKKLDTRWIEAKYGPRKGFNDYVRKAGLKMGQLKAKNTVFIADGVPHNWEIQMENFPDVVSILDFYHAAEHLADFCDLFSCKKYGSGFSYIPVYMIKN